MIKAGTRIEALDSLRGLAALVVLLGHCLAVSGVAGDGWDFWLKYTPARLLTEGRFAVILFFCLSGFVLARPFLADERPSYSRYVAKRICRIYPPYLAAIAVSAVLYWVVAPQPIPALGHWFNSSWNLPLTFRLLASHALMVGTLPSASLDNASWSLVHEMRISLVLPLLAWAVRRASLTSAGAALVIYAVSHYLGKQLGLRDFYYGQDFGSSLVASAHFAPFFVFGALAAKHVNQIDAQLSRTPRWLLALLAAAMIWAAACHSDLANGAAAVVLIAVSHQWAWLLRAPLLWLGKVSYSLYLIHLPVLFAAMHLSYGLLDPLAAVALTIAISLGAAEIMYRLVEAPSLRLSRNIGRIRAPSEAVPGQPTVPATY
jgi:peptidoglycan/LPS O-acetylase OafA/YrhL